METGAELTSTVGRHGEDSSSSYAGGEDHHQDEGGNTSISGNRSGAAQLEEDLDRMGCVQLLSRPWALKSEYMLRELHVGAPYKFKATLRARPSQWTAVAWRKAYGFGTKGKGLCG